MKLIKVLARKETYGWELKFSRRAWILVPYDAYYRWRAKFGKLDMYYSKRPD